MADNRRLCPFCRTPEAFSDEKALERIQKRAESDDAEAINMLGGYYHVGTMGLQQDHGKAMKLWLRAGELGCVASYGRIADCYHNGIGVERDMAKSKYYAELAAMGGHVISRHNIGATEWNACNFDRAVKHLMISAEAGWDESLKEIREGYEWACNKRRL